MAALGLVRILSRLTRPRADTQVILCRVDTGDPFASSRGTQLNVRLAAWQTESGELQAEKLILERPHLVFPFSLLWRQALSGKTMFRARIGPIQRKEWFMPTARLVHVLGTVDDAEFSRRSLQLVEPTEFTDPELGTFTPHPRLPRMFSGKAIWLGREIKVVLERGDYAEKEGLRICMDQLREMQTHAQDWHSRALAKVEEELYPMWVENGWNGDDPVIPLEQWRKRLTLNSIHIDPTGHIEFEFDDGDLFWGHWVVAHAGFDGAFDDARMEG